MFGFKLYAKNFRKECWICLTLNWLWNWPVNSCLLLFTCNFYYIYYPLLYSVMIFICISVLSLIYFITVLTCQIFTLLLSSPSFCLLHPFFFHWTSFGTQELSLFINHPYSCSSASALLWSHFCYVCQHIAMPRLSLPLKSHRYIYNQRHIRWLVQLKISPTMML